VNPVAEDGVKKGACVNGCEGRIEPFGLLLVGQLDDVRGAIVKLSAVAGGLVFGCPSGRRRP